MCSFAQALLSVFITPALIYDSSIIMSSSCGSFSNSNSWEESSHPFHRIPRSDPGVAPTGPEVASFLGSTAILRPLTVQAPMSENLIQGANNRVRTKIHTVRHPFGGDDVDCFVALANRGLSFELMGYESFFFYRSPTDGLHVVFHKALPNQRMEMVDYAFKLEDESPARRVKSAKAPVKEVMDMGEAYKRAFGIRYVA